MWARFTDPTLSASHVLCSRGLNICAIKSTPALCCKQSVIPLENSFMPMVDCSEYSKCVHLRELAYVSMLETGEKLVADVPPLMMRDVAVRPYFLGDCAFSLSDNMMKTTKVAHRSKRRLLELCERYVVNTRKPI